MRIVHQSAPEFYSPFYASPFLLLPAPVIAGLLPAPKIDPLEPEVKPASFNYSSPFLAELTDAQKSVIFDAARILIDVAVDYKRDLLNDHALNTAIAVFRQAVSGKPMKARNPAEFAAEVDAPILEYMAGIAQIATSRADRDWTVDHD